MFWGIVIAIIAFYVGVMFGMFIIGMCRAAGTSEHD